MKTTSQIITTLLSFALMTGVFIHDSKIDKATSSALSSILHTKAMADAGSSDPHIHPSGPGKALLHGFTQHNPSYPPRHEQKVKKYVLQHSVPKGRHAFDHYYLPIVG